MQRIDASTLRDWFEDGHELAVLDAREEGEFGASHLFWAVPCPLSRRELRVGALLPRLGTRIVCVDAGNGLAERLAEYLEGIGATDVAVLDRGIAAWAAAGGVLFSGINVPSKAFGEWVEHHYETESVDPPELKRWLDDGRDLVVLDSRTYAEFQRMSIPRGVSVPGGELAYRIGDLAPDPKTLVVVNCAGRTRSIMGAESLRQAGIPNRVVALRNGTMGWELAGLTCERGRMERFPTGRPATADLALARAKQFAERSGVGVIGPAELLAYADDPGRTLFVLDVRDPEEFAVHHLAGSVNAPGGQLVQATDTWIGVHGARIALVDDDGVRARMSAAWLRQMGHRDVFVVEGGLEAEPIPVRPSVHAVPEPVPTMTAEELAPAEDVLVIDLARSVEFRDGHIPGAVWGIRSRLLALKSAIAKASAVVLTSPDGGLAKLAVPEVRALTKAPVHVLEGGTAGWVAANYRLDRDRTNPPDEACADVYLRPYDRNKGVQEAMRAYLAWEIDLVHEITRDGTVHFGV
jgi:rhodanese-related sulfurtransferase